MCWSHAGFIVALVALLTCAAAVWPVSSRHWRLATVAFQFVAALGVFYVPLRAPRTAGEPPTGAAAAAQLYTLLAGAAAATYWLQLLRLAGSVAADTASPAAALASLVSLARGANGAVRFLAADLCGLCAAALLFVAHEEGRATSAVPLALWGLLLSPGAALGLYLSAREGRLAAKTGSGAAARALSSGDTSDEGATSEGAAFAGAASPARRARRVRKAL
jgi:hypothetical protein